MLEAEKSQKSDIGMERNGPHEYNNKSRNKRVKHATTFKTAPNMFKMNAAEKITTHIGTEYLACVYPKYIQS